MATASSATYMGSCPRSSNELHQLHQPAPGEPNSKTSPPQPRSAVSAARCQPGFAPMAPLERSHKCTLESSDAPSCGSNLQHSSPCFLTRTAPSGRSSDLLHTCNCSQPSRLLPSSSTGASKHSKVHSWLLHPSRHSPARLCGRRRTRPMNALRNLFTVPKCS